MLKHINSWFLSFIGLVALSTLYWWSTANNLKQMLPSTVHEQSNRKISEISQPFTKEKSMSSQGSTFSPSSSSANSHEKHHETEFRYENLKRLMSMRTDSLDEYQLEMVVQQIIHELPKLVSLGKMHPLDATLAHTQAIAKLKHVTIKDDVETINQKYIELYPFPINTSQLDLH